MREVLIEGLTDENDVVVELILAFATLSLAVHLGHLLQTLEHGRNDSLVVRVDDVAHVQVIGAFQLRFDSSDE